MVDGFAIDQSAPDYGDPSYWDTRYIGEAENNVIADWLEDYSTLEVHI